MPIEVERDDLNTNGRGIRRGITAALAFALTFTFGGPWCAFAQQIPVTPGVQVDRAGNGVPVVNITTPNGRGVSHNQYQRFDVGREGVILNNARGISATQLGGHIEGNPNLAPGQSARIILNEVTSTHPSALRGFTEVAGSRAEVVIANPNGITCDGCGFINTSRGVLTTGTPVFGGGGDLSGFRVQRGTVTVEGLGLNASTASRADILARAIEVNAGLWADHLRVVAGAHQVGHADGGVTPIAGEGSAPQFALDVAVLGGMYANSIFLIGTEAGLGVRNSGKLLAYGPDDFILTADGRIELTGRTGSAGNLQITGTDVALDGQTTAGGDVRVNSTGDVTLGGTLAAGVDDTGMIGTTGDIVLESGGTLRQSGTVLAGGSVIASAQAIDHQGGQTQAGQSIDLRAATFDNTGGRIVAGQDLRIDTGVLHNESGLLAAQRALNARLGTLTGANGTLFGHERAALEFLGDYHHDGRQTLSTDGTLTLNAAGTLTNTATLEAYGALRIDAGHLVNAGQLRSGHPSGSGLTAVQATRIDNHGRIDGDAVALTAADIANAGTVIGQRVTIEAERLVNGRDLGAALAPAEYGEGLIAATERIDLRVSERLDNLDAEIHSAGELTIGGADGGRTGQLNNRSGRIQAAGTMTLAAESIVNERRIFETAWENLSADEQAANRIVYDPISRYRHDDPDPSHRPPNIETDRVLSAEEIAQADAVCRANASEDRERCIGHGGGSTTAAVFQSTTTDTLVAVERLQRASAAGQILGGGDIVIDTGSLLNDQSTIAAGGDLVVNAQALAGTIEDGAAGGVITNRGWTPQARIVRTTALEVQSQHLLHDPRRWEPWLFWQYGERAETFEQSVSDHAKPTWMSAVVGDPIAATLSAGGTVDLRAVTIDNGEAIRGGGPSFLLPTLPSAGGLYRTSDPSARWRIETDPRLADYRQWLGSDYLLNRLGVNPEAQHKRLGDNYYETQLVLNQITGLTGRRYLGASDALAQYRALMDAGAEIAGAFELAVGIALTEEQLAVLDRDIVWLVERQVDGETVLVPVVYLSQANADRYRLEGSRIVADVVNVQVRGEAVNRGAIRADSALHLSARNVLNDGGTLSSGGELSLTASHDLVNRNGRIDGGNVVLEAGRDVRIETAAGPLGTAPAQVTASGDLAIGAGRDIVVERARLQVGTTVAGVASTNGANASTVSMQPFGDIPPPLPEATGALTLQAGRDIALTASQAQAHGDLIAVAGRDVYLTSTVQTLRDEATGDLAQRRTMQGIDATTLEAGGDLGILAGRDIAVTAAQLRAGTRDAVVSEAPEIPDSGPVPLAATASTNSAGILTLSAGRDLTSATLTTTSAASMQGREGRRIIHASSRDETVHGSSLDARDAVVLQAERDLTLQAAIVHSVQDGILLSAGRDIALTTAQEQHDGSQRSKESRSGTVSRTTTKTQDQVHASWAVGTSLSGETIQMVAGGDLQATAAQVASTGDVLLAAGNDLILDAGQNVLNESHAYERKRAGAFGGGAAVTVGTQTLERERQVQQTTHTGSLIGSLQGRVDLIAGNDVTLRGSEVLSETGIGIAGANVTIEGVEDTLTVHEAQRFRQSGLSAGLKGGVADAAVAAIAHLDRAGDVEDDRLAALHAIQGTRAAVDAGRQVASVASGRTPAKAGLSLRVGVGSSQSRNTADLQETAIHGSRLASNGDITIAATGDEQGHGGDLTIRGSQVHGENVLLAAANNLLLQSQQETSDRHTTNTARSGGLGLTVGSEAGIGVYASAHQAKGHSDGRSVSHIETQIAAGDTLTLISGNNTTLQGAQARGETVIARVGGDLHLVSEQDTATFKRRDTQSGFDLAAGTAGGALSGYASRTAIDANYRSVNEQTGIEAGTGGFDIEVGGHTGLTGAAIASSATPDKNRLSTGSLSATDLHNETGYNAKTVGVSGGVGWGSNVSGGVSPGLGIPAGDTASSTTRSGIAEGAIEIRDGDTTALASLDRSVTELQQQGLKEIFDEQKVQEQIELGQLAGQVGFRAAGDLAAAMGWQEGSAEKVILHGAVGAAVAALGGGDALQGLTGAAANQLAFNAIREYLTGQDIDPDGPAFALFMQLASLAVGAAAGGESGAGTALAATQNNWLNHREYEEAMQAKAACDQGNAQSCARYEALAQLDQQRDQEFAQYLRDVSLAAHREGKPLDETFYRDIQKQYWRAHLGWGGEPYYLSDTHRPVYPTTQQEAYRFFTEGPGKYLGANAWIATGAAEWAGDFVAAWKDWLNPGSGQNALTGQTIEGVDAWGKRFVGSVELGMMFIGGGMSSATRNIAKTGQVIENGITASRLTPAQEAATWQGSGLYPGVDRYRNIILKPDTYVVGASPGQGNYYTTMSGMVRSELDVIKYYQGAQVAPNLTNPIHDVVRDGLTIYRVTKPTPAAFSRTMANPQYGTGGLPQIYVPDYSTLQPIEFIPFTNKIPGVRP